MAEWPIAGQDEIDPDRLLLDWTLTDADQREIDRSRGPDSRLWTALHLCRLRRTGRFIDDAEQVPQDVIVHLARQLGLDPPVRLLPLPRPATDSAIRARLRSHLGFVPFAPAAEADLQAGLANVAADGLSATDLTQRAEALLCAARVILPARTTLERLVASITRQAMGRLFARIAGRLTSSRRDALDRLAGEADTDTEGRASLGRYRTPSAASMGRFTRTARQRLEEIEGLLAGVPDLSDVPQRIRRQLAQLCRRYDGHALRRFSPDKRHSLLVCFLLDRRQGLLDDMVQAHDTHMTGLMRRARHAADAEAKRLRRAAEDGLLTLVDTGEAVLAGNHGESVAGLRDRVGADRLRSAVAACRAVTIHDSRGVVDAVLARYPDLRKSLPPFLSLPFVSDTGRDGLLRAIDLIRRLDQGEIKILPEDAPTDFVPAGWRKVLRDDRGRLRRSVWETALALAIRDALRSGDLHLPDSRRHAGFWSLVLDERLWATARASAYTDLGLPERPAEHLAGLERDITQAATAFVGGLATNDFARLEQSQLCLRRPDSLPLSPEVRRLRREIESRMPRVRIEDILLDVDRRCGFTRAFRPLAGYEPRAQDTYRALLATLIAHSTNLGLTAMGDSVEDLTAADLQLTSRWLVRDATLKAANAQIVEHHHRLDFATIWGDGRLSSSDGQRFRAPPGTLIGAYHPRYFGHYDKAVTVYTHVSDRIGVFSTQVISCAPREATYVLDGLLDNDTSLDPRLHTTDTHGFTEPLWGLCHLLGIDFMPRLKDLADQRLWRLGVGAVPDAVASLFAGTSDTGVLGEQWDQLVRIAASLEARTAPAHVVLQRLTAGGPNDRVAKDLTALGRLVKTRNILRYLHDAPLRASIQAQLNRGEARHGLARWLFFANQGEFRSGDYEAIMNKASCLGLLSNAVVLWNTLQMERIVTELRAGGMVIRANTKIVGIDKALEMTGDFVIAFTRVMPESSDPARHARILDQIEQLNVQTLSEYQGKPTKPPSNVNFPAYSATDQDTYGTNLLEVMQFIFNHTTFSSSNELDQALLAAYKPLGLEPGKTFDSAKVAPIDAAAFRQASEKLKQENISILDDVSKAEGFLFRAFKSKGHIDLDTLVFQNVIGPIGQPADEALYLPVNAADGKPMNAENDYVIKMTKEGLPPALGFWSVTLYDTKNGWFIPNKEDKYSVGQNAGYKLNAEGGIEIFIAAKKPPGVPPENWLPINREKQGISPMLRLYAPDLSKAKTWKLPEAQLAN